MAYFPMFIDLNGQSCLIAGGGKVALRKVLVLLDFGAEVTVVAPAVTDEIRALEADFSERLTIVPRAFAQNDIEGQTLVIAATDDAEFNHEIARLCREHKIPVNAVDQIEDCSFIFPSYVKKKELVAAFSSAGNSPVMTQYLKERMSEIMTDELGALTGLLGSIRDEVKAKVSTEAKRKQVYREILSLGLCENRLPTDKEISGIIAKYRE